MGLLENTDVQSSFPLKVSREGNVGLRGRTAYRPWPGTRWDVRHWGVLTTIPRDACPITAQNEPGERRDWAGHTKVMMEGGRGGLSDGKLGGQRIRVALEINGAGWSGTPRGEQRAR